MEFNIWLKHVEQVLEVELELLGTNPAWCPLFTIISDQFPHSLYSVSLRTLARACLIIMPWQYVKSSNIMFPL